MTLKDIAELAGVSPQTVSNVINGKSSRVSASTMEKVNSIIAKYHYVPNMSARNLTNRNSNIVAVIITEHDNDTNDNTFENPYLSTMIGIIESELRKHDFYTMICTSFNRNDLITLLKNWNPAGIMTLYPIFGEKSKEIAAACNCPVVMFDNDLPPEDTIQICSNDQRGLYLSTKYLINRGHKHIAFVGNPDSGPIIRARFEGYEQAMNESGLSVAEDLIFRFRPTYDSGILAGKKIADSVTNITAAVTTSDICGVGVMEGARLGCLRIPLDLSVIGYDNLSICNYTTPKLTSVSQNVEQKATIAVDYLIKAINAGNNTGITTFQTDVEIVERHSVASLL